MGLLLIQVFPVNSWVAAAKAVTEAFAAGSVLTNHSCLPPVSGERWSAADWHLGMTSWGRKSTTYTHVTPWEKSETFARAAGDMSKLSPKGKKIKSGSLASSNSMPGRKDKGGTLVLHFKFERIEGRTLYFFSEIQIWKYSQRLEEKIEN